MIRVTLCIGFATWCWCDSVEHYSTTKNPPSVISERRELENGPLIGPIRKKESLKMRKALSLSNKKDNVKWDEHNP